MSGATFTEGSLTLADSDDPVLVLSPFDTFTPGGPLLFRDPSTTGGGSGTLIDDEFVVLPDQDDFDVLPDQDDFTTPGGT